MAPQLNTIVERPRSDADLKICGAAAQSSKIVDGIRLQITVAIDDLGFLVELSEDWCGCFEKDVRDLLDVLEVEMGVRQRFGVFVADFVNLSDYHDGVVDHEGRKIRTTCESCGTNVYLLEGQTLCSE